MKQSIMEADAKLIHSLAVALIVIKMTSWYDFCLKSWNQASRIAAPRAGTLMFHFEIISKTELGFNSIIVR